LGNVDNTSDANKPVSIATQSALDAKANALTTYVNNQIAAIPDADAATKGKIQLAGDLAGTAAAPTVPGLALKADAAAVNAALNLKANEADVANSLALKADATAVNAALNLKANAIDVTNELALKANSAEMRTLLLEKELLDNKSINVLADAGSDSKYPTVKSIKTYVDAQVAGATIADANASTKGKIQLAGDLAGTAAAPTVPGLALKANTADVTSALALKANTSSLSTVATSGSYNDLSNKPTIPAAYTLPVASASAIGGVKVGANLSIDANGVLSATASNNASSITGTLPVANGGTGTTTIAGIKSLLGFSSSKVAIGDQAGQTSQADGGVGVGGGAGANNQGGSAVAIGYVAGYNNQGASSVAIGPNAAQAGQGSRAVAIGFAAGQNGQGANSVAIGSFAGNNGQAANSIAINATGMNTPLNPTNAGFYVDPIRNASAANSLFYDASTKEITYGTAPPTGAINLASGVTGTLPIANGGTGATTASAALTNLGAAPLASPTFTGTVTTDAITTGALSSSSVTAPTYASTPRTLTYSGSTISWNPTQGLNAAITLTQNSTLSFTAAPPVGSYGTVVLTQDATGNRTITLPTITNVTNKVLGSTSTSTVSLSTAANSKDILSFYYDGTVVYWNIGQGYGSAATSASTNLATNVSGTLAVANGGTGTTTLTGLVKGSGTSALTAAVAGTDYQAPLTLTTTGSGAASLSGNTLNIPSTTNYALPTASTSTLGGVKVGTNLSIDGSGVLSADLSAANITGTLAVAKGGTGATTLTGYVKGAGTATMTASATIPVADISGTLPVANGGTGTTTGSITGTTALSFAAGGSNQNITILPSGAGSVGIGTSSPNSLAILDASSTTKGFLPPRMTHAQKTAIVSPPQGLMIYCTNCGTNGEPEYFNGTSWVNMAGGAAASVPPPTLGSTYEGGKVFYILQPGDPGYDANTPHGLIAAPSDIPYGTYKIFPSCYASYGTSTALGTGAANTTKILACTADNENAAKLVDALTDGGYSDWYLPSKDELNLLYLNRISAGNNFASNEYWSSSELYAWTYSSYEAAWYQFFTDGSQSITGKGYQKGVRAIRSF
jgi:hypothetical protein